MPLHPAAPDDIAGLVDAYAHTGQAIVDLGRGCHDADFELPTACPGWTVKDQISHVVGLEDWLGGGEVPEIDVPDYPHIRNAEGAFVEKSIELRRDTPGQDVVDELEAVLAQRTAQFRSADLTPHTVIVGAFGPAPASLVLPMRILDIWTHEQDIREALGRPGNLDSGGAAVFLELLSRSMPRLIAKKAGIEPGNSVIFDVTGPVVGRIGVRVEEEDGKPRGYRLFTGEKHPHEDSATTSITLSTRDITRRAAGRGSLDDIHYTLHGDEDIARRALEAIPFVP